MFRYAAHPDSALYIFYDVLYQIAYDKQILEGQSRHFHLPTGSQLIRIS
jgi:hypothetical protein